uniref:Thioredox_DsbH domain-containing protein n=1 Tax=Heterorhabditis bacteriophora TaxID=37862 RepID=A0A1I7XT33_HETBA
MMNLLRFAVGYSTCHWCHVMEKESFENEAIAQILNDNFISIKVDREERPDVDKLYMSFIQAISGSGGWPMSVFLTPNLEPITGGTYFPPNDHFGRPGFSSILKLIATKWSKEQCTMLGQGRMIIDELKKGLIYKPEEAPPIDVLAESAFQFKTADFDKVHGGFGKAPKFPKAVDLEYLIYFLGWTPAGDKKDTCREMIEHTLDAIRRGGIHDHIGKACINSVFGFKSLIPNGFHRYSVDAEWHVPHFEKMLYDQAQLLSVYSDYSILSGGKFEDVIRDVVEYMFSNLSHPEGGFYSAEDADSLPTEDSTIKKEGAFCVWEKNEIDILLKNVLIGGRSGSEIFCEYYNIKDEGNVTKDKDPHGELIAKNVLRMIRDHNQCANYLDIDPKELYIGIEAAKDILKSIRSRRPLPHLDSKMVTAWQGLAITALAKVYLPLFILFNMQFIMRYKIYNRPESIPAFSDDYAFFIQGLLDLYQGTGDANLLKWAEDLQRIMVFIYYQVIRTKFENSHFHDNKFWDHDYEAGYFISEENESGVKVRIMEDQDGAEPCANSVAVGNLIRLYEYLNIPEFKEKAHKIVRGSASRLIQHPCILTKMIPAYKRLVLGCVKIVVLGDSSDQIVKDFLGIINSRFIWNKVMVHLDASKDCSFLSEKSDVYNFILQQPSPAVFICTDVCSLPITTTDELRFKLDEISI